MLKFRIDSKQFFLTYPKCNLEPVDVLERLKNRFLLKSVVLTKYVIAKELHKDGDPHIHCYVAYSSNLNLRRADCFDLPRKEGDDLEPYHGNYQGARSAKDVVKYCVKGGLYITNMEEEIKGKTLILERKAAIQQMIEGNLEVKDYLVQHPNMNYLGNYCRLKANLTALRLDLRPLPKRRQVCGKWLIGRPGVGKSHFARTVTEGDLFVKLQTKWWCGYAGQKYVLLEDLSKPGKNSALCLEDLATFLKLWTDKWDSVGETKGGANVPLRYTSFWVSSNYTIEEIFEPLGDSELIKAIKRRFVIIPVLDRDDFGRIEKPAGYEDSVTQKRMEELMNPSKSPDPLPTDSLGVQACSPSPYDLRNGGDDSNRSTLSWIFKP